MQIEVKAEQKCTLQMGGWAGSRRGALHWRFQDLKLLLGSADMGWSVLENWLNVSLTSGDCATSHQLFPHIQQGSSWPWVANWSCHFLQARGQQDTTVGHKSFPQYQWPGWDSLSTSKTSFSAIRCPNSLFLPSVRCWIHFKMEPRFPENWL
jgi:hypothetical protein